MNKHDQYIEFLRGKIQIAENAGFDYAPDELYGELKPHQKDIIKWACAGGRRAIFASFGLGKTIIQLEIAWEVFYKTKKPFLIGLPLGVKHEFIKDAQMIGLDVKYVTCQAEVEAPPEKYYPIFLTNYERIREGNFNPEYFGGVSFDEASILRGLDTKTSDYVMNHFKAVEYRFVATATPSPNEYTEILNYADFLGIMDRGQALTRFFQRDSQKAGNLTLLPNREEEFWNWVSSWAIFITRPSDLGYDDTGYDLPEIKINYHRVSVSEREIKPDRDGQIRAFADPSRSLQDHAREKRDSIDERINKMQEIISENPDDSYLIWHHLEDERKALQKVMHWNTGFVFGNQDIETKESILNGFASGDLQFLATKPVIAGSGCNFQYNCHRAIFLGIDYKFNDFIQAVHRIHRFLQKHPVVIDIIYTDAEDQVLKTLLAKWKRHEEMIQQMTEIIKKYGLNHSISADLKRTLESNRHEIKGNHYRLIHNDSVLEAMTMEDNTIDMVLTSIPFSDQYEYSETYNDMGHNNGDGEFFQQLGYLTDELLRILKPGRVACIHVKDRVQYSYQNGQGFTSLKDFSGRTVKHFEDHGFWLLGKHVITTDVVRENNQTYRLGWSEQCKDATKMGSGLPEYLLVFRKTPSDTSNAYADHPVIKTKKEYTRAQWQIDAHAYWKSSGDRLMNREELIQMGMDDILRDWKAYEVEHIYNHKDHLKICEQLDEAHRLPAVFMGVPPCSNSDYVWDDINRMHTLNSRQMNRKAEKHICPLQIDIVERCITRYSNPGEKIYDPFGGIMTVPYMAVKLGRYGIGSELNYQYYLDGIHYCREAEYKIATPSLFDIIKPDAA